MLVIDDQPYELQWLTEYVESKGLRCENAVELEDGVGRIETSETDKYRLLIVDMEIQTGAYVGRLPREPDRAALYKMYPGLQAVQTARNYDYDPSSVLIYSVHQSEAIHAEVNLLRCRYMLKGRPRGLKEVLNGMLSGRRGRP